MRRMLTLLTALALLCAPGALGEAALPEPEAVTGEMILGEAEAEYFYEATLYYVGTDGLSLSQATRTLLVRAGATLPETALEALFDSSGSLAQAAVAPADTRLVSCELSGGVATVDLSIEARNVQSEQELLLMYLAIAGTLTAIDGIDGVNVLINGRQESVLGVPCGILDSGREDVMAAWAQAQAEAERYAGSAEGQVTRTAAVYYPAAGGEWLVPEAREITFAQEDCVDALLSALCAQPEDSACVVPLASEGALTAGEPSLNVTGAGERVLELNLSEDVFSRAVAAGVEPWQVCGALTVTMCSFVPELDAVRLSVGGTPLTEVERDGQTLSFADGLMRRRDFSGFVGSPARIFLADEGGALVTRDLALSRGAALSPRALLEAVLSEETAAALGACAPVSGGLDGTDVLGVRVEDGVAVANLSSRFYGACQALDEAGERTAVYAVVNTLCELPGVDAVQFLIEGESVETLAGTIYLRTVLLPNPGAVTG